MTHAIFQPITLVGEHVRIEPATLDHASEMAGTFDDDTFRWFFRTAIPGDAESCAAYLRALIDEDKTVPFSLFDARTNEYIGGTSYCDIRAPHRGVEVGWTWIAPPHRRKVVNPEMKLLLLRHAFETPLFAGGSAIRVMLKTHHLNERSRGAILKLGAKQEGILRNHVLMPNGTLRHSVVYSITPEEWPDVRAGLEARIAVFSRS
ncbi:MAG: GNAT family protein [Planctomycetota bacterium]